MRVLVLVVQGTESFQVNAITMNLVKNLSLHLLLPNQLMLWKWLGAKIANMEKLTMKISQINIFANTMDVIGTMENISVPTVKSVNYGLRKRNKKQIDHERGLTFGGVWFIISVLVVVTAAISL